MWTLWSVAAVQMMLTPFALQVGQATPDASSAMCATADRLRAAELYDAAEERYVGALDDQPDLPCARVGVHLSQAGKFLAAGDRDGAERQYDEALAIDPSLPAFETWLGQRSAPTSTPSPTSTPTPTSTPVFDAAKALSDAGFEEEARTALSEAIAANPRATVPSSLAHLVDDNAGPGKTVLDWRDGLTEWWARWSWLLVWPLVAVAAIALLVRIWPTEFRPAVTSLFKRQRTMYVDIQPFEKGAIDLDLGTTIEAQVEYQYARFKRAADLAANAKLVTGPPADPVAESVVAMIPDPSGTLGRLWKVVMTLGQKHLTLRGVLAHDARHGAGILLSLREGTNVLNSEHIWTNDIVTPWHVDEGVESVKDDVTAEHFTDLAEAVAIWVHYEVNGIDADRSKG